jgi:hypothetical protein
LVDNKIFERTYKIGVTFLYLERERGREGERERGREGERERGTSTKLKTQFCLIFEPSLWPDIFERSA